MPRPRGSRSPSRRSGRRQHWGVPLLPRTDYLLAKHLTAPITYPFTHWVIIPLFIVFYAGELVWRERDAGLSESVDATSVPEHPAVAERTPKITITRRLMAEGWRLAGGDASKARNGALGAAPM